MHLLKALRTVSRIESSAIREEVFLNIAGRSRVIRIVLGVHGALSAVGLSHVMVAMYGLSYFLRAKMPGDVRWVGVAVYPNEVKQLDELDLLMAGEGPGRVIWGLGHLQGVRAMCAGLRHGRDVRRLFQLARRIDRQHRFMPACRVMVALFLYVRFRQWLKVARPRAVVVTSDYSPDGVALASAADGLKVARVYVPHALPSSMIAGRNVLAYELYVFDSEAMRARFAAMAALSGEVVYWGVRGAHAVIRLEGLAKAKMRVGIFLSGMTDLPALRKVIGQVGAVSPEMILVRGHPVDFANPDFSGVTQTGVVISQGTTLVQDAQGCDVVLAGNTTAILECLRLGTPVVYCGALDMIPHDYNGFVADGLVPEWRGVWDAAAVRGFFDAGWQERMRYFDAAYGRDADALRQDVRRKLLELLA